MCSLLFRSSVSAHCTIVWLVLPPTLLYIVNAPVTSTFRRNGTLKKYASRIHCASWFVFSEGVVGGLVHHLGKWRLLPLTHTYQKIVCVLSSAYILCHIGKEMPLVSRAISMLFCARRCLKLLGLSLLVWTRLFCVYFPSFLYPRKSENGE
jgi:hypothetical protein